MHDEYFIQTDATPSREQFENVDRFTWENYKTALKDDGKPRYPEGALRFARIAGAVVLDSTIISEFAFGVIGRVLNLRVPAGSLPAGPIKSPQYIKFAGRSKGKQFIHEVGGENYRQAA